MSKHHASNVLPNGFMKFDYPTATHGNNLE